MRSSRPIRDRRVDRIAGLARDLSYVRDRERQDWPRRWLEICAQGVPVGALPVAVGPSRIQHPLIDDWVALTTAAAPTPTTLTPNALGATTGRVFPFYLDANLTVSKIYMATPAAGTGVWQLGIFDGNGNQEYTSGAITTVANITTLSPTAFRLNGGLAHYLMLTNNASASTTSTILITPAFAAATVPRWGTLPVTAGAIPTSIVPTNITATVGGFPCYIVLSAV